MKDNTTSILDKLHQPMIRAAQSVIRIALQELAHIHSVLRELRLLANSSRPGNHVVLAGYYGFENTGDEAMLQSIVHALRRQDKEVYINVFSDDPISTERMHLVRAVSWRMSEENVRDEVQCCDRRLME